MVVVSQSNSCHLDERHDDNREEVGPPKYRFVIRTLKWLVGGVC